MKPNRYDLILLFAVVSGIYYVIDETLSSTNNAPKTAETLPVLFSVDASPQTAAGLDAARAGASETVRERGRTEEMGARRRCRRVAPRRAA